MQDLNHQTRSYLAPLLGLLLLLGLFTAAGRAVALPAANRSQSSSDLAPACGPTLAVVTINPTKDNTLYKSVNGDLSNGAGQYLFAGNTAEVSNKVRRALVAFKFPDNALRSATVLSATLDLHMSKTIVSNQTVSLHRVLADWGEATSDAMDEEGAGAAASLGDATWLHTFYNTEMWSTAGGDYVQTVSVTQTVGFEGFYTWGPTDSMVADVQSWLQEPDENFGWIVIGNEETETVSAKRFDSRDNDNPAYNPKLTVWYSHVDCSYLPMIFK